MQLNEPRPPISPELRKLQQPGQDSTRRFLRRAGLITLGVGVLCLVIGTADFFISTSRNHSPGLFWLCFLGMPLIFFGAVMSKFGFMGAIARYVAGEIAPVATDATNYVAEETKGAVETVAKAAAKGAVEGIDEARAQRSEGKD